MLFIKKKQLLISASLDLSIRIWNSIANYSTVTVIDSFYFTQDTSILYNFDDERIIIGYLNILLMMNISTHTKENLLNEDKIKGMSCIEKLTNNVIAVGCDSGNVIFLNIHTKQKEIFSSIHKKKLNNIIKLEGTNFLTVCDDMIILWKY